MTTTRQIIIDTVNRARFEQWHDAKLRAERCALRRVASRAGHSRERLETWDLGPYTAKRGQSRRRRARQAIIFVHNVFQLVSAKLYGDAKYGPGKYRIRTSANPAKDASKHGGLVYHFAG